jgi:TolA-binding protein
MTRKTLKVFFCRILLCSVVFVMLFPIAIGAKDKPKDQWQIRENLVIRLGGEWYKINILRSELQNMQEILHNLRDIELFPGELTKLSEESLLSFDKQIETVAKKHQALIQQVESLRPPLIDAMAILREMVIGQPVEDMFQVLDNDDMRRIATMFAVKHHIDSLWRDFDGLFGGLSVMLQMQQPAKEESFQGFEAEFFEILKANLGQQSERYYRLLRTIKDTLYKRGTEELCAKMFQVETHRIKLYLKSGNESLAKMMLPGLLARYKQRRFIDECNVMLMKASFSLGEYDEALRTADFLSDSMAGTWEALSCKIQSLYLLKRYKEVWEWARGFDFKSQGAVARNLALWLSIESGLALGASDTITALASQAVKDSSYAPHILHCLGRYYVKTGDWNMAQSVFESALRLNPSKKSDEEAQRRILLTLAQSLYERGDYQKALPLFFNLLNQESYFAEALFGISWCYLGLGDDAKAETSLRKLINQNPWSPLSAEGLLITMERYCAKARSEWDKNLYLSNEEQRLLQRKDFIAEKLSVETGKKRGEVYLQLSSKIEDLLLRLKKENRASHEEISAYYEKAERISQLISAYYRTGTFQEVVFSEKRENLLRGLDSLLLCVKDAGRGAARSATKFLQSKRGVAAIKECVKKSDVAALRALIDRYRWEREYIDWQKTSLKREKDALVHKELASSDSAQRYEMQTRQKKLNARMDSLVRAGDEVNKKSYQLLTVKCSAMVALPLDSSDEAYLRYHLGEIYYGHENENYATAYGVFEDSMAIFDSLLTLYHQGKRLQLPTRPAEPALNHDASMEQYRTILEKHPRSPLAHAVHYSLAWCFNDQGKLDSAVAHMQYLADNYPTSQYCAQAWMYLGEYMFDHAKLDRALKAYQSVMKFPESEWFDKALYKLAWTQYRLSNPEKAIGSFLALVDLGVGARSGKTLLEKESIDYIAISFSETDATGEKGLQRAVNFVRRFGDQAKGVQILHRLATIFKEQGRFDMAQKTYSTLLRTYPDNQNSPLIESELLAVLEKNSSVEEANIGRVEFFNKYNKNGDWAKSQSDAAIRRRGDSLSCKLLYEASISYHQLALQKNDTAHYAAAADNYQLFIQNYPQAPQASECHYNFAEIMFSLGDYKRAAEEYIVVSTRYSDGKYKETAAWNAIVASQNLLKKEGSAVR